LLQKSFWDDERKFLEPLMHFDALNEAARERMRAARDLGDDVRLTVERGERHFASGDRVMFLQNERGLGVKNGTLGTVDQISRQSISVHTDDGRSVRFDLKDYDRIDHGYAATIHKAQGMTVDRSHVLATPGMDAHSSYVALSRNRDGVDLHYGRDDFAGQDRLVRTLSRHRAKDMASDYERADPAQGYAERRGITFRERVAEIVRKVVQEKLRSMFDGSQLRADVPGPDGGKRPKRDTPERERSGTGAERRETEAPERKLPRWRRPVAPRYGVSVECPIFRTLLVALYRHDANTPAQDRGQLGVAEFVNGAVIVDRRVDYLHGLAFEPIGDLLEGPALLVHERTFDELLGEAVDLLALVLVRRVDAVQLEAQRVGEYLFARLATRIA
jgi:hypothetical protein